MQFCYPPQIAHTEGGDLLILSGSLPVAYLVPARGPASETNATNRCAIPCLQGWVPWQALDAGLRHRAQLKSGELSGFQVITITHHSGLKVAVFFAPSSATVLQHLTGSDTDFSVFPDGLFFHVGDTWQAAAVSWSDLLAQPA